MMKKKYFLISCLFLMGLVLSAQTGTLEKYKQQYDKINKTYSEKTKAIKNPDESQKLDQQLNMQLETLLKSCANEKNEDGLVLLQGHILFDLLRVDEAIKKFDILIGKSSPLIIEAKLGKIKTLMRIESKESFQNALILIKEIENKLKPGKELYGLYVDAFFASTENRAKEEYARKFLAVRNLPETLQENIPIVYQELADLLKKEKKLEEAKKILDEGLARVTDLQAQKSLQAAKLQLALYGELPPAINAETWLESSPQILAGLKGHVVVMDFWAPWCQPCRRAIPVLVAAYNQLKDKGLVVIGITKLYEKYSDEQGSRGKVSPDEEVNFIGQFLQRFKITYPVAISRQVKDNQTFQAYGITVVPTLILIDKSGKVNDIRIGFLEDEAKELVEKIESLLDSK